jgi:hypothetical protein
MSAPTTLAELFRSLGLTLTVRAAEDEGGDGDGDEDGSWACTLTRPDGATHEVESVTFFDVDPDTGDEWIVEPTPSRVLSVLAGGDAELEDGEIEDGGEGNEAAALADTEAAARAFLGDESYETLLRLDAEGLE